MIDETGRERVRAAVERNEKRTSAEIVPVIVRMSSACGHVPWVLFLALLLLAWVGLPFLVQLAPGVPDWTLDVGAFAFAFGLTVVCERLDFVRRWFTPKHDQAMSVERRAVLEFHLAHVEATDARTGVLVFVSALERRAVVLADQAVVEKLPQESWAHAIELLVAGAKKGDYAEGICAAIDALGDRLEKAFPAIPGHANQLDDRLIIKL
jgi:putative membrane protein